MEHSGDASEHLTQALRSLSAAVETTMAAINHLAAAQSVPQQPVSPAPTPINRPRPHPYRNDGNGRHGIGEDPRSQAYYEQQVWAGHR